MHGEIADWKNGWYGVSLGLSPNEIEKLIRLLEAIHRDHEQHFHLSSDYSGSGGLGDVEIYVLPEGHASNMAISGTAIAPDDTIEVTPQE